jgi:PAS domain S-box-containing protein
MRIKNQFRISIIIFLVILSIIAASLLVTQQQAAQLSSQETVSIDIQTHASNLAYISNDYYLYQESPGLDQWQTEFSFLTSDLSKLSIASPEQQALINNTSDDAQRLNSRWTDVALYLENAPRNVSIRVLPEFQTKSSRMSLQNQALIFDAQQLSETFHTQIDQLNVTRVILVLTLLGLFGAYLVTNYLVTYRKTLNSISELQAGIAVVGSGNLDYFLKADRKDEMGEISRSVNQMAANLKNVTASKTELEQVQASLRESEQRWATTLASIGDAVIATDLSGKVIFMNEVAEELTGWTLSEALQKPVKTVFNIINEQTRLEVESPIDRVLREGMVVGLANHTVLIRKDASEVPIDDSGAPIRDKDGKTTGVVLVFRDITERKKAEDALSKANEELEEKVLKRTEQISNERQRLYNVLETLPAYIILLDKDYCVPFANKVFRERFGESHGKQCYDFLFNRNSPCENCETYKVLKTNGPHHWEWTGPDNRNYDIYDFPFVEADGSTLILEMGIDVTDRKKAEALAQESAKKLKDSERLAAIGATAGMVGHDIRNPLQAITGDVYLAKTDLASMPESEEKKSMQESLEAIEKNVSYINKIVADLQDFAKPISAKLEEIDLEQTIHSVLARLDIPGNVTVKHSVRRDFPKLKTDQAYMQRILSNLANNAIQAMPKGGKLAITAVTKNGKVIITVEDNGEGIPENVRSKLFTPLMTTKSKGQGFGLSVVKRFTEGMGGTVSFESEVGKGTKFIIELPL